MAKKRDLICMTLQEQQAGWLASISRYVKIAGNNDSVSAHRRDWFRGNTCRRLF